MVLPNEVSVGMYSPFLHGTAADLDLALDLLTLLVLADFLEAECLDVDLTLEGAPPDKWEYFDMLSALIF